MIRLEHVNKYFNKHKKNAIHVINDTTLNFPSSGLVALLGPSGSGKTTILNTIGGLDKVNSGNIFIDGKRITRRSSRKIDEIRNLNIGYIFQDYKLVEGLTVYENVALSLKIIGLKDKDEIQKRVLYTLEKVGMARYKNRPVNMLSGGERQRVGIARALVKNPKIIIADEPTGNLDSKNSLEIMNIIKSISEKYLVILVTHEEELARFYATRIVELQDGKVLKDYDNKEARSLNYRIENQIYLKDFKSIERLSKDNINVDVYRDQNENLNISVVFKNGNIYIATNGEEKIEVVESNSNIELIDEHYTEINDLQNIESDFNLEEVASYEHPSKYSSIFKLGSFITYGFKKILDYPVLKKILLGGFFLSGMFIFYAVSSIFATLNVKDEDFININRNYLIGNVAKLKVDDYLVYENNAAINYMLPGNSQINFEMPYNKLLQTSRGSEILSASLSDIESISEKDLIKGRMPKNNQEIVIDKLTLTRFIKVAKSKMAGFFTIDDFLNQTLNLRNLNSFTIVGITDGNEPNVYAQKELFLNMIAGSYKKNEDEITGVQISDYTYILDKEIKLYKGELPKNDYEVIVSKDNEYSMPLNKSIDYKVNNTKLKVVGYYENINGFHNEYFVNKNTLKYSLIDQSKSIVVDSKNKEEVLAYFQELKMNIKDSYQYDKDNYLNDQHDSMISALALAGVILGISLIEILLMIRSSFLSRIKEVGIYRAIGVKKSDIYKMFSGEIFAITCVASITGIIFMSYILGAVTKIPYVGSMFMVNVFTILISIVLVLIFNIVIGLLPVFNTIRKTPAQILSRFDVD